MIAFVGKQWSVDSTRGRSFHRKQKRGCGGRSRERVHRRLPVSGRGQAIASRGLKPPVARELSDQDEVVAAADQVSHARVSPSPVVTVGDAEIRVVALPATAPESPKLRVAVWAGPMIMTYP